MTTLIQTWKTSDGKSFDDKVEAEGHQFDLDFKPEVWFETRDPEREVNEWNNAKNLTTHELAKLLLSKPDLPAYTHEGVGIDVVRTRSDKGKVYACIGDELPM